MTWKKISYGIRSVAIEIAEAVRQLQAHWDRCGTAEVAFDPTNQQTNRLFNQLWEKSFNRNFPPDVQDKIVAALECIGEYDLAYADTIKHMHRIGHVSERHMEFGHVKKALSASKRIKTEDIFHYINGHARIVSQDIVDKETYMKTLRLFAERLKSPTSESLSDYMYNVLWEVRKTIDSAKEDDFMALEKAQMREEAVVGAMATFNLGFINAYAEITSDFPYKTYRDLMEGERCMLGGLKGINSPTLEQGTLLFIEAGPLPETAIYYSMSMSGARVLCTNRDAESCEQSRALIAQLEKLHILEPGRVQVVQADPLSADFKIADGKGRPVKPYAALISQLVDGRKEAQQIAAKLVKQHDIDTIIVRGAHHLSKMLYETVDELDLPGAPCRYTAVPKNGRPSLQDATHADQVLHRARQCYNSSHVYSTRPAKKGEYSLADEPHAFQIHATDSPSRIWVPGR